MSHWRAFPVLCRVQVPSEPEASLRKAAEAGNFLKECALGQLLFDRGNHGDAFKHFSHAAESGSAVATHNIALMTEFGFGVDMSEVDAVKLYRRASHEGIVEAKHRLGYHLALTGDDGGGDIEDGTRLIREAAQGGLPEAMYDYGMMHFYDVALLEGSATADTAVRWLDRAFRACMHAKNRSDLAAEVAFQLAVFHYKIGKGKMSSGERVATSYKFAEFAAEAGHALAQDFLGQLLVKGMEGAGAGANFEEAAKWFHAASEQGVVSSKRDLALLYESGALSTDSEDAARAIVLYQEAADAGDVVSKFRLGVCYGKGALVAQDTEKARGLLLEAARANCVPALGHVLSTEMAAADERDALKLRLVAVATRHGHPERIDAIRALSSIGAIPSCHGCGITKYERDTVALSTCSTCRAARYCTTACQKADWKNHRDECKAIVRVKDEAATAERQADEGESES